MHKQDDSTLGKSNRNFKSSSLSTRSFIWFQNISSNRNGGECVGIFSIMAILNKYNGYISYTYMYHGIYSNTRAIILKTKLVYVTDKCEHK